MSAQPIPKLLTVEDYEQIPNPPGGRYELHHGELAFVPFPIRLHWDRQQLLCDLLRPIMKPHGYVVGTEYPYRPLPENEVWSADVACVKASRHVFEKWLNGSPELVIEVRSPSNTNADLHDHANTTLRGAGAVAFWVVDPKSRAVTVYSATGVRIYQGDEEIPLAIVPGQLHASDIFA